MATRQNILGLTVDFKCNLVVVPREKVQKLLDLLESECFSPGQQRFPLHAVQRVCESLDPTVKAIHEVHLIQRREQRVDD